MNSPILIGKIAELFNSDNTVKKYVPAKFVLVSTDNIEFQMLLHLEERPFEYHAQAVLKYMDQTDIEHIYCFGGAKISLGTIDDVLAHAKSYAFNTPNDEILSKVIKSLWPNAELQIMTSGTKLKEAQRYDKAQVKHMAENP